MPPCPQEMHVGEGFQGCNILMDVFMAFPHRTNEHQRLVRFFRGDCSRQGQVVVAPQLNLTRR